MGGMGTGLTGGGLGGLGLGQNKFGGGGGTGLLSTGGTLGTGPTQLGAGNTLKQFERRFLSIKHPVARAATM